MKQTRDEWLALWEDQMQAILFRGYFCREVDAGQRYRKMEADAGLIRKKLAAARKQCLPDEPAPEIDPPAKPEAKPEAKPSANGHTPVLSLANGKQERGINDTGYPSPRKAAT